MRNINLEAAIWNLFTSMDFFEATAREFDDVADWFAKLAISRQASNFGRNNQIFDKLKQRARDFRRGAEMARLGDYRFIWDIADSVRGDARGIMEQPLHAWMSESEYQYFSSVKFSRLLAYSSQISHALNNAIAGAASFFDTDPEKADRRNDDDGYPGDSIIEEYTGYFSDDPVKPLWNLPNPLPDYKVDMFTKCKTGDVVPWTGIWIPQVELERYSLTFAIKGLLMQPAYKVLKTTAELSSDDNMFPKPQTLAVAANWHPLISSFPNNKENNELWAKAGSPCPKSGIWQPTDPGAAQRAYRAGEPMDDLKSAYGYTVWKWIADR